MNLKRALIAVAVILVMAGVVLGVDWFQRRRPAELPPGSVPIYVGERLIGAFVPEDLDELDTVSFVDAEEGKTQEGWLLRDVLLLHVAEDALRANSTITVSSSSREKSARVTWEQADNPENSVLFDLSSRGTLKLVSRMQGLDTRDTWVQDVDKIEIAIR
jgi:hypothetical protein